MELLRFSLPVRLDQPPALLYAQRGDLLDLLAGHAWEGAGALIRGPSMESAPKQPFWVYAP